MLKMLNSTQISLLNGSLEELPDYGDEMYIIIYLFTEWRSDDS